MAPITKIKEECPDILYNLEEEEDKDKIKAEDSVHIKFILNKLEGKQSISRTDYVVSLNYLIKEHICSEDKESEGEEYAKCVGEEAQNIPILLEFFKEDMEGITYSSDIVSIYCEGLAGLQALDKLAEYSLHEEEL
jgi:hypothetical protein